MATIMQKGNDRYYKTCEAWKVLKKNLHHVGNVLYIFLLIESIARVAIAYMHVNFNPDYTEERRILKKYYCLVGIAVSCVRTLICPSVFFS
jgi:hypothetical protein